MYEITNSTTYRLLAYNFHTGEWEISKEFSSAGDLAGYLARRYRFCTQYIDIPGTEQYVEKEILDDSFYGEFCMNQNELSPLRFRMLASSDEKVVDPRLLFV